MDADQAKQAAQNLGEQLREGVPEAFWNNPAQTCICGRPGTYAECAQEDQELYELAKRLGF